VKRALLGALAAIMLIAGIALLAIAGWVFAAFGSYGIASTSLGTISASPNSAAIVIDVDTTRVHTPVIPIQGETTLHVESSGSTPLLVGSGDRSEADSFIGGREIDVAYREGGVWSLRHVPGIGESQPWPQAPDWLTTGVNRDIAVRDGQTVVIARADGSSGIQVTASLKYAAPHAREAMLALAISGGVLALAGLVLGWCTIWIMRRRPVVSDD